MRKIFSVCLVILLVAVLPLTTMAQEIDYDRTGSISVTMASQNGAHPMAGAKFSVYYVAYADTNAEGKLHYYFTDDFAHYEMSIYDPQLTAKLNVIVSKETLPSITITTDTKGKAVCDDLPLGLYFIKQLEEVEGFAPCSPFLVTIPTKTENGYAYDVDASPKTDIVKLVDITVKKVWNEDKSSTLPSSVTVQLLRDGEVLKTATLNKQNKWQVVYEDLPASDGYSIKEVNVPKGFTATYTKTGYVFTVTNTSSLIQTGQLIWPIPVLAVTGMFFMLLGFAILRKSEKSNA